MQEVADISTAHVILTRFNLPSAGAESLIRARDGWLHDRVALFERYCLPSVRAQTVQDFVWLVYFDPDSPQWLHDWIASVNDGFFVPIFRLSVDRAALLADIRSRLSEEPDVLITSNLDNDDAIATTFVERVALLARIQTTPQPCAIYLGKGLVRSGNSLYRRTDISNAFCSVTEPWSDAGTCWAEWHNLLSRLYPVVVDRGEPGWLQVVHGGNVSNRARGRRTRPGRWAASFPGLLGDIPAPGRAALILDASFISPMRWTRDGIRAGLRRTIVAVAGKNGLDRVKTIVRSARARHLAS